MSILSHHPTPGELDHEEQARLEHEAPPERPMNADDAAAWWQGARGDGPRINKP